MAVSRFSPSLCSCWQLQARLIHKSSSAFKKQYDFDLDSLINWKKETKLSFGPQRKLTKTGKLRKTKEVVDYRVQDYLQTLSVISERSNDHTDAPDKVSSPPQKNMKKGKNHKMNIAIPTDVQSQKDSSSSICKNYSRMKTQDFDIPEEILALHTAMDTKVVESCVNGSGKGEDSQEKRSLNDEYTEDGIFIEKIVPIPNSDTSQKTKGKLSSKVNSVGVMATKKASKIEMINDDNDGIKISSLKKKVKSNTPKLSLRKNSLSDSSCVAPLKVLDNSSEMEKMTNGKINEPQLEQIALQSQGSINTGTTTGLPVSTIPFEPPKSFEIISKISFNPKEDTEWQMKAGKVKAFKMDVEQMSLRVLPAVKSILNKTMPDLNRYFLNRWREGMINELGEEGFRLHQDATIKRGINLHANIMEFLSGKPISELQIMPDNEGHWSSLQPVLSKVSDIKALELKVVHPTLLYRGVFDCVGIYKDLLCVIDWKTSKKPRPLLKNTYDDPLQIAAYAGALNASEEYVLKYGEVNHGLLVVAYPDGSPAHIHLMNRSLCEKYWNDWTERLHTFYQLTFTEKMSACDQVAAKLNVAKESKV